MRLSLKLFFWDFISSIPTEKSISDELYWLTAKGLWITYTNDHYEDTDLHQELSPQLTTPGEELDTVFGTLSKIENDQTIARFLLARPPSKKKYSECFKMGYRDVVEPKVDEKQMDLNLILHAPWSPGPSSLDVGRPNRLAGVQTGWTASFRCFISLYKCPSSVWWKNVKTPWSGCLDSVTFS